MKSSSYNINTILKQIKKNNFFFHLITVILIIQLLLTYGFTNTKKFSIQAYIMNVVFCYSCYIAYKTSNLFYLLIPLIVKLIFILFIVNIPQYITTEYLYNDYFENVQCKNDGCLNFYTEGDYNGILPFNTLDTSNKNVYKIQKWAFNEFKNPKVLNKNVMNDSQLNKYKWIVEKTNINSQSKVLEMGFGKLDLMEYIRNNTGATIEGTNISKVHVDNGLKNGFKCYQIDHTDIGNHLDTLKDYDLIICNGTLEYLLNTGDILDKLDKFTQNINKMLKPGGLLFITTIHFNGKGNYPKDIIYTYLNQENTYMNMYNIYNLAYGNEGSYPLCCNQFTNYLEKNNLKTIKKEDHTLDYFLYSINWYNCQKLNYCYKNKFLQNIKHFICYLVAPLYLESYLCYTRISNKKYLPWLWQFIRQKNGYQPVTHQWIISEKV